MEEEQRKALEKLIEDYIANRIKYFDQFKKYSGQDFFSFILMPLDMPVKACTSSNIESYGYDEKSKALRIIFRNGGDYSYLNVPRDMFDLFEQAESKGTFIARIKIRFSYVKVK